MTSEFMCGMCFNDAELYDAPCAENPESMIGVPVGMYHCPECGIMLVAGFKHPQICRNCLNKLEEAINES